MSTTEDLLLLMTDTNGHPMGGHTVDLVLAGAALGELARAGRMTVGARQRIEILSRDPVADQLLDRCLRGYAEQSGKAAQRAIPAVGKGLADATYTVLAGQGLVHNQAGGFLRRARHVVTDPTVRERLVGELSAVVVGTVAPDTRTGSLIGLLHAAGVLPRVIDGERLGLSRRALNAHAKQLADGDWATGATREAIKAAHDATVAVLIATTAATTVATTT